MQNYKLIWGALLSGLVVVAVSGCGGGNGSTGTQKPTATPTSVPTGIPTPMATATPSPLTDKSPTLLYFSGEPDEYVSQGQTRLLKSPRYSITFKAPYDRDPRRTLGFFIRSTSTDFSKFELYNVEMEAPQGQLLRVGTSYNAVRFPFNNEKAGLDFSGDGRGCNTLNGKFTIRQLVYNSKNELQNFEADFEQACGGSPKKLTGTIRFNSTLQ